MIILLLYFLLSVVDEVDQENETDHKRTHSTKKEHKEAHVEKGYRKSMQSRNEWSRLLAAQEK